MDVSVFFSWQSDTPAERGRLLVERALSKASEAICADTDVPYRPSVDQDTRGIPGSPAMVAAILKKIDACSIFVADVSLTFDRQASQRQSPNPNVLIELGYALRRLGSERVLLILDTATGRPEQLPFDLRGSRVVTYDSSLAGQANIEDELAERCFDELRLILNTVGPPEDIVPAVQLTLEFSKQRIGSARHDYRLHVNVANRSTKVLKNWTVEVRFPGALLNRARSYPNMQASSSDGRVTMRQIAEDHTGPIYPGDNKELLTIDYFMDHELHERSETLFPQKAEAALYVEGVRIATADRRIKDLQVF